MGYLHGAHQRGRDGMNYDSSKVISGTDRVSRTEFNMALHKTSSAPAELTTEQRRLAEDLMRCHGNVKVSREMSGLHFYIACPECLAGEKGETELWKMHLAMNVDKYLRGNSGAAQCMRTGKVYRIDELTMWPLLETRGYTRGPAKIIDLPLISGEFHEEDEKGRWVPKGPGETIPLHSLPFDHPAIEYLHSRKFSITDLSNQFSAQYCVKERTDIRYRRLLHGFRATPQGRVVFYIYHHGVRVGWQARILEREDENHLYYFHPYKETWMAVKTRETPEMEWMPMEGWEEWDPAKYIAAHGMRRNSILMGFDSARAWNAFHRPKRKFCFLLEGPLDAGRLGPPAVATCGKFLSEQQAAQLMAAFDTIIIVPDNDAYGSKLYEHVGQWIGVQREFVVIHPPRHRKDAGEMTEQETKMFRLGAMRRARVL
jgi:hypothetical protein